MANSAENLLCLVGMGANLPSRHGGPLDTLIAALAAMEDKNISVLARSPWFESEPVPKSDQGWFVNGAALIKTSIKPNNLLKILHEIEIDSGRVRSIPNAARPLDLDLLMIAGIGSLAPQAALPPSDLSGRALVLPHPRLKERAFVLRPLRTIAGDWVHPETGQTIAAMEAALPDDPVVRLLQR